MKKVGLVSRCRCQGVVLEGSVRIVGNQGSGRTAVKRDPKGGWTFGLLVAGIGSEESFETAIEHAGSFGLFIRSLVGLDRAAAKEAFAQFLDDKQYSKNQIEFVNLIIDYLTEHGVVEPGRVYASPFTSVAPEGPEGLFGSEDVTRIFEVIDGFTKAAA